MFTNLAVAFKYTVAMPAFSRSPSRQVEVIATSSLQRTLESRREKENSQSVDATPKTAQTRGYGALGPGENRKSTERFGARARHRVGFKGV